jgi:Na+-driven multidrug efflux pump
MVNRYGAATSAGYGAATQLWGFIQMPIGALSASVAAMASQNIGAGQWSRVRELALKASLLGAGITSGGVLLVYALGEVLLGVFLPEGGDALRMALRINLLVLWSWIPLAITMVLFGIVRANGAMMPPTLIMVGTLWVVRLPFAEVFQRQLGADAIWLSFPVGTIMCAVLACVYYRFGRWKTKSLLGELA